VTLLEHARWLAGSGRAAEVAPPLETAAEVFAGLDAQPWLDRLNGMPGEVLSA
jgi:hypothetical protein